MAGCRGGAPAAAQAVQSVGGRLGDQLLTATNLGSATLNQSFSYDIAGNMTSNSRLGAYTYPAATAPRPHAPLTAGPKTLTYDANGNMTGDGTRTLFYDGDNRPTTVNTPSAMVTYVYGPDGKRLKKANGGDTTLFLGSEVEILTSVGTPTTVKWTKYLHSDA